MQTGGTHHGILEHAYLRGQIKVSSNLSEDIMPTLPDYRPNIRCWSLLAISCSAFEIAEPKII